MSCFDLTHAPVATAARAAATGLVSMSTRPDPEGSVERAWAVAACVFSFSPLRLSLPTSSFLGALSMIPGGGTSMKAQENDPSLGILIATTPQGILIAY